MYFGNIKPMSILIGCWWAVYPRHGSDGSLTFCGIFIHQHGWRLFVQRARSLNWLPVAGSPHACWLVSPLWQGWAQLNGSPTEPNRLHQHLYPTSIPFEKLTPKKPTTNLCTELQSHNFQHQPTKSNSRECHRVHRRTSNIRPI